MRFSKAYIPTSKESPNDATLASHILLIRAGYIQSVASGLYNLLPLGKKLLENIIKIVREELDKAGCQEVELSFVTPAELWEESGRINKFGKELLRFRDRKDNLFVLGPTHEEMMVNLIRNNVTSYKQLPLNLYQIKTKFRDEARPRFGLMRAREFVMKDGYSFHSSDEDMKREFQLMEETYRKIFQRLGLDFRVVEADSGAIGGSGSKEFMVLADSGEDTLVVCPSCQYGANIETAKRAKVPEPEPVEMNFGKFYTPNLKTIEELSQFFHIDPYFFVKAVIKKAIYEDGSDEVVVFFVRGSDELEETKAINSIGALELLDTSSEELEKVGLVAGFVGFIDLPKGIRVIFDIELEDSENLITGANEVDYHYIGAKLDLPNISFADIAKVREGDMCPTCGGRLEYRKGIEVGHIFQLGTTYSEKLEANFLDQQGKSHPIVMGTYGIGVSRLISAIVEQSHDDRGIVLPKEVAPYRLNILISNIKNSDEVELGEKIYNHFQSLGVPVILDDRKERFGFKIRDAELIGFPYTLIIGKSLKNGEVEILHRKENRKEKIAIDKVIERVEELVV
ncbi:MAG TPA: proline--tRNA ligase [Campylobacterales bacterium]|nr:proline--tRNA ligase [Campylobacterales bacterium]